MKFIIKKSGWLKQKYSFQMVAKNGEIIAVSEKYHNLSDLEDTIQIIKLSARQATIVYDFEK